METLIIKEEKEYIKAINALKNGEIVAIPTETVYGLAGNALDENSIDKIYSAKGRPSDNPLIVHIGKLEDVYKYAKNIKSKYIKLLKKFWPGPLTCVFEKQDIIPSKISGGLNTVAIRLPKNEIARKIIIESELPLAAPSANISGRPSPTKAQHVYDDLKGKIPYIIDGGQCSVGVESTVLSLVDKPVILRPGKITKEDIEKVIGKVELDKCITNKVDSLEKVSSPGMKYKHYSPSAEVFLVKGDESKVLKFLNDKISEDRAVMCFEEDKEFLKSSNNIISYGKKDDEESQTHNVFDVLREFDKKNVKEIYVRHPKTTGKSLAVFNRLLKASGYNIIYL